jgi:hypothetical protein
MHRLLMVMPSEIVLTDCLTVSKLYWEYEALFLAKVVCLCTWGIVIPNRFPKQAIYGVTWRLTCIGMAVIDPYISKKTLSRSRHIDFLYTLSAHILLVICTAPHASLPRGYIFIQILHNWSRQRSSLSAHSPASSSISYLSHLLSSHVPFYHLLDS